MTSTADQWMPWCLAADSGGAADSGVAAGSGAAAVTLLGGRQVHYMDYQVGVVLAELKSLGLWDDSLIVFHSDNVRDPPDTCTSPTPYAHETLLTHV